MPASRYVPVLIAGMLITGSSNSLWSKWQDMQCVENCDDPNPAHHVLYEQPVWQTLQMFLGEMLCFLPVIFAYSRAKLAAYRAGPVHLPVDTEEDPASPDKDLDPSKHLSGWKILLLWLPAVCDLTATTLMNVGLLYTPVSIYQMTRGALVLFVGILSVIFLHRRLWLYQWISLVTVMAGVSLVGLSGSMIKNAVKDQRNVTLSLPSFMEDVPVPQPIDEPEVTTVLVGVFFILFAQIFTAAQFVIEEKIMARYSIAPLLAVGYEGFFGTLSIVISLPILAHWSHLTPFFDLPRGWTQMINSPAVLGSGIAIAFSIALFNFFGLSVTRHVSATARSLTDTCRTLSIWVISLLLGWEMLVWPISVAQVVGFALLVYGTFLFNNLVAPPPCLPKPQLEPVADQEDGRALLEEHLDETAILPADLGTSGYDVVPDESAPTRR